MKRLTGSTLFGVGVALGAAISWLASSGTLPAAAAADAVPLGTRVQELEDHLAIEQLLMQYGATLDSRDFAAYSQLFARQGTWSGNIGTFTGPAAIKEAMEKAFNGPGSPITGGSFHLLTNPIIHVHGDHGTALSKWTFCRMVDGKPSIIMSGHYEDTLVREGGSWKFMSRVAPAATTPAAR
jgi:hypothetical protein